LLPLRARTDSRCSRIPTEFHCQSRLSAKTLLALQIAPTHNNKNANKNDASVTSVLVCESISDITSLRDNAHSRGAVASSQLVHV